jgi:hypothetical protein
MSKFKEGDKVIIRGQRGRIIGKSDHKNSCHPKYCYYTVAVELSNIEGYALLLIAEYELEKINEI